MRMLRPATRGQATAPAPTPMRRRAASLGVQPFWLPRPPHVGIGRVSLRVPRAQVPRVLVKARLPERLQLRVFLLPADIEAAAVEGIGEDVACLAVLRVGEELFRAHIPEGLLA